MGKFARLALAALALMGALSLRAAAAADGDVLDFFDRPQHSLSKAFSAQIASKDVAALGQILGLMAGMPTGDLQSYLKSTYRVDIGRGDLEAAAAEAKAYRHAVVALARSEPIGARVAEKLKALSQGLSGSSFDGPMKSPSVIAAAAPPAAKKSRREFYASWGYNGDQYAPSDMHFQQQALGNDFTLRGVVGHDKKGWNDGLFSHAITVPQYDIHAGYFLNEKQTWAVELAIDHPKWIVTQGQTVRMTGALNGQPVDKNVVLTPDVLKYQLNNGANPILLMLVRRMPIIGDPQKSWSLSGLAKAGVGFVLPHTENTVFGQNNKPGFQLGGWDTGLEAALRLNLFNPLYLEFAQKGIFAHYTGLHVNQGTASQNLMIHESILSLGVRVNLKKDKRG